MAISETILESKELASLRSVYTITGFPINVAYTDINAILSTVFNTDLHSNADKGIEFAAAVACIGYPGRFISAWIYIANLKR
jgi:coiled-coil and C2 domain-containing protein 2A